MYITVSDLKNNPEQIQSVTITLMRTGSDICTHRFYVMIVNFHFKPVKVDELLQEVLERLNLHRNVSFWTSANALIYSAAPSDSAWKLRLPGGLVSSLLLQGSMSDRCAQVSYNWGVITLSSRSAASYPSPVLRVCGYTPVIQPASTHTCTASASSAAVTWLLSGLQVHRPAPPAHAHNHSEITNQMTIMT